MKHTGLVQGVPLEGTPLVTVKALRGFYDQRKMARRPGELVECSLAFARYLVESHKAAWPEAAGLAPSPAPPESAPSESPTSEALSEPARKRK